MTKKKMSGNLAKFLRQRPQRHWRGGQSCMICSTKKIAQLNEDIRQYAKARKSGHPMPWSVFYREYIVAEYKIPFLAGTALNHARRCLGLEI